jgi:undecaprenyl-diphosphatase
VTLLNLFLLAVVQGITEFLPISSQAHLILIHELGGPTGDDLALDIAVHLGSIAAVVVFLRAEVARVLRGLARLARGRPRGPEARLAAGLIVATVPAVLAGGVIAVLGWAEALRDIRVIGTTMIVFGALLWLAHRLAPEARGDGDWRLRDAAILGLWQALALIPGVSRSGITMTGARLLGFERHAAARLSILMSIPVTLATGALLARDVGESDASLALLASAAAAAVLAFLAAWAALVLMMRFLARVSFTPYVIYRIVLGIVLLSIAGA